MTRSCSEVHPECDVFHPDGHPSLTAEEVIALYGIYTFIVSYVPATSKRAAFWTYDWRSNEASGYGRVDAYTDVPDAIRAEMSS